MKFNNTIRVPLKRSDLGATNRQPQTGSADGGGGGAARGRRPLRGPRRRGARRGRGLLRRPHVVLGVRRRRSARVPRQLHAGDAAGVRPALHRRGLDRHGHGGLLPVGPEVDPGRVHGGVLLLLQREHRPRRGQRALPADARRRRGLRVLLLLHGQLPRRRRPRGLLPHPLGARGPPADLRPRRRAVEEGRLRRRLRRGRHLRLPRGLLRGGLHGVRRPAALVGDVSADVGLAAGPLHVPELHGDGRLPDRGHPHRGHLHGRALRQLLRLPRARDHTTARVDHPRAAPGPDAQHAPAGRREAPVAPGEGGRRRAIRRAELPRGPRGVARAAVRRRRAAASREGAAGSRGFARRALRRRPRLRRGVRRPLHARVGRRSVAPVARLARGLRPVAGPRDGPRRVRRGLDLRRHDVVHLLPDGQRLERVLFYLLRGSTPASDVREMYRGRARRR